MDKKDIYEHLAKIYLDASSKKKKNTRPYAKALRNILIVSVVLSIGAILLFNLQKYRRYNSEIALVLLPDVAKINFHFDPARKEVYSVNLNELDLTRYKALGFSVKKLNYENTISLRVEFINSFKEKSEIYFKDLPHKWQDYKINFSQFRGISDWSEMRQLSFAIEEWNAKEKKGVVLIDNVRVLK